MALGDPVYGCNYSPSVEEMLTAIGVTHANGTQGIRVVTTAADGEDLTPMQDCPTAGVLPLKTILRNSIRQDACGQPALFLFTCSGE